MMKFFTPQHSINILLVLVITVLFFHGLVLTGVIPYSVTWGGRLQSHEEMVAFETVAVLINLVLLTVLLMKGEFISHGIPIKWIHAVLWVYLVMFCLNTVGNLMAETWVERIAGSSLTLLSAFLCYRIVRS